MVPNSSKMFIRFLVGSIINIREDSVELYTKLLTVASMLNIERSIISFFNNHI